MSGWLFDTNVLSAFAPGRPLPSAQTREWVENRTDDLFLSTVAVREVEAGVAKLLRLGALRRSDTLKAWLEGMLDLYEERLLDFDLAAARIAGRLHDAATAAGRHPGFADIAIAAIAMANDLVVLTANQRHFEPLGVETLNPLDW